LLIDHLVEEGTEWRDSGNIHLSVRM